MSVIALIQDSDETAPVDTSSIERAGYQIIQLCTAEEIICVLSEQPIDLYIINLPLSFVNGHALTRLIRMSNTAVGIILNDESSSAISHGLNKGADLCLVKPIPADSLLAAINSLYRRIYCHNISGCQKITHCQSIPHCPESF